MEQPPSSEREGPPSRDPFNPFTATFRQDPYPHYRRIRDLSPVHRSFVGVYMLTKHADILAVLRDPDRFSSQLSLWERYRENPKFRTPDGRPTPVARLSEQMMIFRDPPAQMRLRRLVQQAFTPRAVQGMRPWIEQYVERLLDDAEARGRGDMEIIADLAWPLPVGVISEMLGVPMPDRDFVKLLSRKFAPAFAPMTPGPVMDAANAAASEFEEYFNKLAVERRKQPGDDLLSALLAAEETGDKLTIDEVVSNCFLLFFAGHETTVNLIGNGLNALLRNRPQIEVIRDDSALIPNAVDELLRYDSPFQLIYRNAREDVEIRGTSIPAGEQLFLFLGSANRDEEAYPDPDVLDVRRKVQNHLGFGHGLHFCLGAALGRLEAQAALAAVIRRYPRMEAIDVVPQWGDNLLLRGLLALPVRY